MTWVGPFDVANLTDDEIEEFAEVVYAQMVEAARRLSRKSNLA
jgi:hypothetical protein